MRLDEIKKGDAVVNVNRFYEIIDRWRFRRLLNMQDKHNKEFFDVEDCCGLEIEFGVVYERRCRAYIETGLKKMKEFVGSRGKFVPDDTIGRFLNVEIVLNPFPRDELKDIFNGICAILSFYDNFVFDDWCGLHANFRADDALKESFYNVLTDGRYDQERFNHGKYRTDFMNLCRREDGSLRDYEEYLKYQNIVGAKYCGVNFLKPNLIEVRTLNLCWSDVEFFIDAYEEAKKLTVEYPADAELLPAI